MAAPRLIPHIRSTHMGVMRSSGGSAAGQRIQNLISPRGDGHLALRDALDVDLHAVSTHASVGEANWPESVRVWYLSRRFVRYDRQITRPQIWTREVTR
jgi:hypothetical protein